ncbi:MAG: glycosyltransferase family 39 protein [Planctomycetota bacterium]|nr:glycosyltransferase family 39 protein [Planctomycetota bacterium]
MRGRTSADSTTPDARTRVRAGATTNTLAVAAVGAIVLAGLLVRLPRLTQSLWFDEVFRTRVVLTPERIGALLWHDVHNPLYNAVMYAWVHLFGDREWVIRLPGVLAGAALVLVVFAWVRERWGRSAARWAAAWLWLTPAHVWYSCEAKNNIVTALLATLGLWTLDRACVGRTGGRVALAAIAGALAIWTDFQSLLVLPFAWIAWTLWGQGRAPERRAWVVPVVCAVGTVLLASPLLVHKAAHASELQRDYLRYFSVPEAMRLLLVYFPTGNALVPTGQRAWPLVALLMAPVVLPSLVAGVRAVARDSSGRVVLVALAAPMCVMVVASEILVARGSAARVYQERNLLVMLPLLAAVLGVGAIGAGRWRAFSRWGLPIVALVSSVGLVTWSAGRDTLMYPNPDWRGACAYIGGVEAGLGDASERDERDGVGRGVLVVSRTPMLPVEYYLPRARRAEIGRDEPPARAIRAAMETANTLEAWLIVNPNWHGIGADELAEVEREFRVVQRRDFRRLRVLRLRALDE